MPSQHPTLSDSANRTLPWLAALLITTAGAVSCDVAEDPTTDQAAETGSKHHHHHNADAAAETTSATPAPQTAGAQAADRGSGAGDPTSERHQGKHGDKHPDGPGEKRDSTDTAAGDRSAKTSDPTAAAPTPGVFWYATLHDAGARDPVTGQESVFGFGSDGRSAGGVLAKVPDSAGELQDFRGMLGLADGSLLVIAAWKHNTEILRFGPPGDDARRPYIGVFTRNSDANPLLVHPYGMAVGPDGSIYVSNQDSNTVTRYGAPGTADEGKPLGRDGQPEVGTTTAGLVVPSHEMSKDGIKEVRGIAFLSDGTLLVADRGKGEVTRWDVARGKRLALLASKEDGIETPIQLLIGADDRTLYISDNKRNAVFTLDLAGGSPRVFLDEGAGIDAGSSLAILDGHLYVGSRKARAILRFGLADGAPDPQPRRKVAPDRPRVVFDDRHLARSRRSRGARPEGLGRLDAVRGGRDRSRCSRDPDHHGGGDRGSRPRAGMASCA
ncbi:MAG: hypothetical protein LW806_11015 [Planctomycetaceae bacterium]|nr:hypothetical protein [Planctomycetaceae bacterium]